MYYPFAFRTQYSQFYLADAHSAQATDSVTFWTDQAFAARLACEEGIVGVVLESTDWARGEICLLDEPSTTTSFTSFDHVVEASLEIGSGILQVLDCPHSTLIAQVVVPAGWYRVRVYSAHLASVVDEVRGGDDTYHIELWPQAASPRALLKSYTAKW